MRVSFKDELFELNVRTVSPFSIVFWGFFNYEKVFAFVSKEKGLLFNLPENASKN